MSRRVIGGARTHVVYDNFIINRDEVCGRVGGFQGDGRSNMRTVIEKIFSIKVP